MSKKTVFMCIAVLLTGILFNGMATWLQSSNGIPQEKSRTTFSDQTGEKNRQQKSINRKLKELISEKRWKEMAPLFVHNDSGPALLEKYFGQGRTINIMNDQPNKLTYKVKFEKRGEIGVITYVRKDGKYADIQIKNQIRPLYFIEGFKKYRVKDVRLTIGDAKIHFIDGFFYRTSPFDFLLLFRGKWKFHIRPNDREERLTLERQYNNDHFTQSPDAGIFILPEKKFLDAIPPEGETTALDPDMEELYRLYRESYGVKIKQFNEYWYLPFGDDTNIVIFKKDKKAFYFYSYHRNSVPDTLLGISNDSGMILSYNSIRGIKLSLGSGETVSSMRLSLFFNPQTHFLSGTVRIDYNEPASLRVLALATRLNLAGNLNLDARGLNIFRKKGNYYLMGPEEKSLSLFYKGHIEPTIENFEFFQAYSELTNLKKIDQPQVFFLSRTQDFYPNPGDDFFKTTVSITLPGKLNCLASGNLVEKSVRDASVFKFESVASKGISLVTGTFSRTKKLRSRMPVHFFTPPEFQYPRGLDFKEIKKGCDFFVNSFGKPDLSAVNILLKKGYAEGGISNYGFIVMNVLPPWGEIARSDTLTGAGRVNNIAFDKKRIQSPILVRSKLEDNILHELAHQWWGGMISWKTYRDNWITEGLAQFSVLYFLKKHLPEKKFNRIIRRVKRWIFRYSDTGPVVYGTRIRALENRTEPYQSVIYNKTAFVFLMLMDIIGEKETIKRLKSLINQLKYKSVTSPRFIKTFCGKDAMLKHYFKKWLYSRTIPTVKLRLNTDHKDYDGENFKKVAIDITQVGEKEDTDFIFPLFLKVTTTKGSSIEKVIVKKTKQTFVVTRKNTIRTIDIVSSLPLVKERKIPQRKK